MKVPHRQLHPRSFQKYFQTTKKLVRPINADGLILKSSSSLFHMTNVSLRERNNMRNLLITQQERRGSTSPRYHICWRDWKSMK